ncbi:hypothetical protein [Paludibacterium denitrificans]|uniref:hypothetical protein n=1 Tax=Paludibacterium denitrificans TaxID=2675226 RepID=UPI001E622E9C|nr:hypothetical protein [Paludibacterium denitrificans]
MKTGLCLFLAALTAPALAAQADWVVYQRGSALELAVDRQSIWLEKDGLVHFVNQERFSERQYEKGYRFAFDIRRTDGYADCSKNQFALVGSSYYTRNNQHIFSSMFPLQRYAGHGSRCTTGPWPMPCCKWCVLPPKPLLARNLNDHERHFAD